jgi:hypothetical protein
MPYSATVIPTMIASPGDAQEERGLVRKLLHEWNAVNSEIRKAVLAPVGWETHASPRLRGRAQEIINSKLLKKCDLLVGVFWTRLGSPTGEYESGTVEEIKKHVEAGKLAMVYFCTKPVVKNSNDHDQYGRVIEFKEWCKAEGIIGEYEDLVEFEELFRKDLALTMNDADELGIGHVPQSDLDAQISQDTAEVQISDAALKLLQSAIAADGRVLMLRHLGGTTLQAGSTPITHDNSRREIAKWEGAIEELESLDLLRATGPKREIFEATNSAFEAIDRLAD